MNSLLAYSFAFLLCLTQAFAQDSSDNHVDPTTLSPDGRYGVTVPDSPVAKQADGSYEDVKDQENAIIEVKTGHRIGAINGGVAFEHMNHDHLEPTYWAADD